MKKSKTPKVDIAAKNFKAGWCILADHPAFSQMLNYIDVERGSKSRCSPDGWVTISQYGALHVHPNRVAQPEEWAYVVAHCLLHLAFGHFQSREHRKEWQCACDNIIAKFLADLKIGVAPESLRGPIRPIAKNEEALYESLLIDGLPAGQYFGTAGSAPDMFYEDEDKVSLYRKRTKWAKIFANGIGDAITAAVNVAAGVQPSLGSSSYCMSPARRAQRWFISSYPLLGAMAAAFKLIEDPKLCANMDISIAAVNADLREIYINSSAALSEDECRFVMAHEFLHVCLEHSKRRQGRDPYIWNVACDYVINFWLIEMGVGQIPEGLLFDNDLAGLSAEAIYDRIVGDLRRFRKLCTLRGKGKFGDIMDDGRHGGCGGAVDLDEFYRRCIAQGLNYHQSSGRGLLPAGLVEEIRALAQPPIPWDVELAQWFDAYFPSLEKYRSYARQSRRQSAVPDIPRPRFVTADPDPARTFGVVLDTSGSMCRRLLAMALGSIASYSIARDVPFVRVVYCDAMPYDAGFIAPESILSDDVKVSGRGGTQIQPAIDLLDRANDFPDDAPILVITDGECDKLIVRRDHAFLVPQGAHLPFHPRGPVFFMTD